MAAVTQSRATAEEQAAEFTRLYEARAYLIYNLALRITCERKSALAAAETAFVRQAEAEAGEATLVPATVSAALGQAGRKPKPGGVGDAELPLLRAVAALAAPERAALALAVMADLPTDAIAAMLQVGAENGAQLLERAMAGFAEGAGIEVGAVYDTYLEWGWAEPPAELWERVYPAFRRAVDRSAGAAADAPTEVFRPAAPSTAQGVLRRWRRRMLSIGTAAAAAGIVAAILGSTQASSTGPSQPQTVPEVSQFDSGSVPPSDPAPLPAASQEGQQDPVAAVQSKPHKPLTAKELDQLRLKELEALRSYQKRETDRRLTKAQRDYAANKVSEIRRLAQERAQVKHDAKALASRERALARARARIEAQQRRDAKRRQQEQADQGAAQTAQPKPRPSSSADGSQGAKPSNGSSSGDKNGAPTSDQAQQTCVQDQDTGAYICPEG